MLGPESLKGVRNDIDCRGGLAALDAYLAERSPPDSLEDRKRMLADLERRLLRVQVVHGTEGKDSPFAYLRDVHVPLFVRLLAEEAPEEQALILRHAQPNLVHAFLERQPPQVRERLVAPLIEHIAYNRSDVEDVAARFRDLLSRHTVADHHDPMGDLLQVASPDERRRLLGNLRGNPEALRSALGSFVSEETVRALDNEVLAAAILHLDSKTAAIFLASLDEVAQKRLLSALPPVSAQGIAEEAELISANPTQRLAARRSALAAIRIAIEERGLDLADMNRRALGKEVAS
jgi:flagellar motor switch protein FliG